MTLRERIVDYLKINPGVTFTNQELALILNRPEPSVRRATYRALMLSELQDGGHVSYNPNVVTYRAPNTL